MGEEKTAKELVAEFEQSDILASVTPADAPPAPIYPSMYVLFCSINGKAEAVGVATSMKKMCLMLFRALHRANKVMSYGPPDASPSEQVRALRQMVKTNRDLTLEDINKELCFGYVAEREDTMGLLKRADEGAVITSGPIASECKKAFRMMREGKATMEDYGVHYHGQKE